MLLAPVQRGINYLLKIMIKQMYTSKNDDHRLDKESGSITNANNSYESMTFANGYLQAIMIHLFSMCILIRTFNVKYVV